MNPLYLSPAVLISYDGDQTPPQPAGAGEPKFTQDDLNRILGDDRRKHQAQVQRVEKMLEERAASKNLTVQEREQLAQQLDELRAASRTKEEQLLHEKKQLEDQRKKEVEAERKAGKEWERFYKESTVERSLLDAVVGGEAYNAKTMMAVLRPLTRLTEVTDEKTGKGTGKFKVVVDFPDNDPATGEPIVMPHTPESAVKRMKDIPEYSNLFKSGAVGGTGANSGVPASGKLDVRKLTQAQYMEIREKNPELLGLRAPKKGHR
jgi:hypothetical protein